MTLYGENWKELKILLKLIRECKIARFNIDIKKSIIFLYISNLKVELEIKNIVSFI